MGFAETSPAKTGFGSAAICTYDNRSVTGTAPATAAPARGGSVPTPAAAGDAPGGSEGPRPGLSNREPTADSGEEPATPARSCAPTAAPGRAGRGAGNAPGQAGGTGTPLRAGTVPGGGAGAPSQRGDGTCTPSEPGEGTEIPSEPGPVQRGWNRAPPSAPGLSRADAIGISPQTPVKHPGSPSEQGPVPV